MSPEIIPVVNENDEIISFKDRSKIKTNDIYRVSGLWVFNSKGAVLLAKRAKTKKNNPGFWGPGVAGTVNKNETYESNIIKESFEELGLKDISFEKINKEKTNGEHKYFCQWFKTIIDKEISEFKIQTSEVDEIKWVVKEIY